jgi:signal peptidase I
MPPGRETYHRGPGWVAAVGAGMAVAATIAWTVLRHKLFRVAIEGVSMAPALLPGDWALAAPTSRLRRGVVVVVEHPGRPGFEVVKRVTAGPGDRGGDARTLLDGEYWVEGDHPASSTDSRHFGPVRRDGVKARVLLIYWPTGRRRVLRA